MVLVLKWLFTLFVTNSSPASTFMFIYASNSDLNEKMPCTDGISLQGDKVYSLFFFWYVFKVSTNQRAPTIRSLCTCSISHWSHPFLDHFTLQLLADHLLLWKSGVSRCTTGSQRPQRKTKTTSCHSRRWSWTLSTQKAATENNDCVYIYSI